MKVSLDGMYNSLAPVCGYAGRQVGRLKNYTLSHIKLIPMHVKNPKIGFASIIGVTLVAYQVSDFIAPKLSRLLQAMRISQDLSDTLACSVSLMTILGSSFAFYRWALPAVAPRTACTLVIMTLVLRTFHHLVKAG
jgi:hypothetical protein